MVEGEKRDDENYKLTLLPHEFSTSDPTQVSASHDPIQTVPANR